MYLVSDGAQRVRIRALDLTAEFADGESIFTESSYKYSPDELEHLAGAAGLSTEQRWVDSADRFSLSLLTPQSG
jgi:uncharacterized SAM-dependent methyltransferase